LAIQEVGVKGGWEREKWQDYGLFTENKDKWGRERGGAGVKGYSP